MTARAETLAAVAPQLGPEQLTEALEAARTIGHERYRATVLAALATRQNSFRWALTPPLEWISRPLRSEHAEALAVARAIGDGYYRSHALVALAAQLGPKEKRLVLAEALAVARAIRSEADRAHVLAVLAAQLGPKEKGAVLAEALAVARKVPLRSRSWPLAALAPQLRPKEKRPVLAEVLSAARESEDLRQYLLPALAPQLGPKQLTEALALARAIGSKHSRSRALVALALELGPEEKEAILAEVLTAARSIGDEYKRLSSFDALLRCVPPSLAIQTLLALVDVVSRMPRRFALWGVTMGSALTSELGGKEAIMDLRRAINDVCRWYP